MGKVFAADVGTKIILDTGQEAETLATAGVWTLQAYVEFTADKYWGEKVTLEVEAPIS